MIKKKNSFLKKNILLTLLFFLLITFDQIAKIFTSKIMINNNFADLNIFPFLNIVFVRNTGISFGLFSDGGIFNRYFLLQYKLIHYHLSINKIKRIICEYTTVSSFFSFLTSNSRRASIPHTTAPSPRKSNALDRNIEHAKHNEPIKFAGETGKK